VRFGRSSDKIATLFCEGWSKRPGTPAGRHSESSPARSAGLGLVFRTARPYRDEHFLLRHFPALRAGPPSLCPSGTFASHHRDGRSMKRSLPAFPALSRYSVIYPNPGARKPERSNYKSPPSRSGARSAPAIREDNRRFWPGPTLPE